MKKLIICAVLINCITAVTIAQSPVRAAVKPPPATELTTEDKNGRTAKEEASMQKSLEAARLTDGQMKKAREIVAEFGKKNKQVKDNEKLTAEEKGKFGKSNNEEQDIKLKEIMGEEKFNLFNAARKQEQGKEGMKVSE